VSSKSAVVEQCNAHSSVRSLEGAEEVDEVASRVSGLTLGSPLSSLTGREGGQGERWAKGLDLRKIWEGADSTPSQCRVGGPGLGSRCEVSTFWCDVV
jgi:hypothetical protein